MRKDEIERKIEFFKNPAKLYDPKELLDNPKLIPRERGIYGWYFDTLPPGVPEDDHITVGGYKLLYVGIAGSRDNGKGDLRRRLLSNHLGKNTTPQSTLRRTLGRLLKDELQLTKHPKGTPKHNKYWFGEDGEKRLRNWMATHAQIAFQLDQAPRDVEISMLGQYGQFLHLNNDGIHFNNLYKNKDRRT